jgi:hypothetical protein
LVTTPEGQRSFAFALARCGCAAVMALLTPEFAAKGAGYGIGERVAVLAARTEQQRPPVSTSADDARRGIIAGRAPAVPESRMAA